MTIDDDDEIEERLEMQLLALNSQLMAKDIMLSESVKIGTEINASIHEHARDMEREIANSEARIQQSQVKVAEMRNRTVECRGQTLECALILEGRIQQYDSELRSVRKRERDAIAARSEISASGRQHAQELQSQLSALEEECAKLQVLVGKFELESAPFARMQQQYQLKRAEAEAASGFVAASGGAGLASPSPSSPTPANSSARPFLLPTENEPSAPPSGVYNSNSSSNSSSSSSSNNSSNSSSLNNTSNSRMVPDNGPRPTEPPPGQIQVAKQGYLLKLSPVWLVGMQRRYFYLEGGPAGLSLTYYKLHTDRAAGLLPLGDVPIAEFRGMGNAALLASLVVREGRRLRIKSKSRTYELEGANDAEAEAWTQAILSAVREAPR